MGRGGVWDELPSGPERRRNLRSWTRFITEATAASASFMLSLAVFSVAGLNALRGPEIKLVQPETMMLYREGEGDAASLSLALDAGMINEASNAYGDVLTEASLSFGEPSVAGPSFGIEALVELVHSPAPKAERATWVETQVKACEVGVRCVATSNALIIERDKRLLDVPGAGSRTETLGFVLQRYRCEGSSAECASFEGYRQIINQLRRRGQLRAVVTLRFNGDGEKRITCLGPRDPKKIADIYNYLEENGWTSFGCEAAESERGFLQRS